MKICIVTTVHPPKDVRIFYKQAAFLAQAKYEVVLLNPHLSGEDKGVSFVKLSLPSKRLPRIIKGWKIALQEVLQEAPALCHIHDPELLPLGKALAKRGIAVVYDSHEDFPRQLLTKAWLPQWVRPLVSNMAEEYENRAVQRFAGVVSATPTIAKRFPGGQVFCNYSDEWEFSPEVLAAYPPYLTRKPYICYVGGLSTVRGLATMLEAIASLDVRLLLAGEFETALLQKEVQRHPVTDKVDYLGVLGRQEVVALLGRCRVGLLLLQNTQSYRESMPIKLFEYMLAGLPVVANDFPLWRELSGGHALFVNPTDPTAAGDAIGFLLQNPERAQELGERGRQHVLKSYPLAKEQERLLDLYQRILKGVGTGEHPTH